MPWRAGRWTQPRGPLVPRFSSLTPLAFAISRARCSTSWKRWFSASFSSTISSMEAGKSGNTSTEIMRNLERCSLARSQAIVSALKPPSDPSLATTICLNMSHLLPSRFDFWQEPFLRDHRWHYCAGDHGGEQNRVLLPVDDVVGFSGWRGNETEVLSFPSLKRRI